MPKPLTRGIALNDARELHGNAKTIKGKNLKLDEIVKSIPKKQDYIKAIKAYTLFGISWETLYRLIHKGIISHINLGIQQIRVSKEELMKLYPLCRKALEKPETTHRF